MRGPLPGVASRCCIVCEPLGFGPGYTVPVFRVLGSRSHPVRKVERYRLGDDCTGRITLSFEYGGVTAVPLAQQVD
jgi:hypothetical protein